MSDATTPRFSLVDESDIGRMMEIIMLESGVYAACEAALQLEVPGAKISEWPHRFHLINIQPKDGWFSAMTEFGEAFPAHHEYAYQPKPGLTLALLLLPREDDSDTTQVKFIELGVAAQTAIDKAHALMLERFGRVRNIEQLGDRFKPEVYELIVTFDVVVEAARHGRMGRMKTGRIGFFKRGTRMPPIGISVRAALLNTRLHIATYEWRGMTTAQALAIGMQPGVQKELRVIQAVRKGEFDPFKLLKLDLATATKKAIEDQGDDLMTATLETEEQIGKDPVVAIMEEDGKHFEPDLIGFKIRQEYIQLAVERAKEAIDRRDRAAEVERNRHAKVMAEAKPFIGGAAAALKWREVEDLEPEEVDALMGIVTYPAEAKRAAEVEKWLIESDPILRRIKEKLEALRAAAVKKAKAAAKTEPALVDQARSLIARAAQMAELPEARALEQEDSDALLAASAYNPEGDNAATVAIWVEAEPGILDAIQAKLDAIRAAAPQPAAAEVAEPPPVEGDPAANGAAAPAKTPAKRAPRSRKPKSTAEKPTPE